MKSARKTLKITRNVFYTLLVVSVFILLPFVVFTLLTSKTDLLPNIKSFVIVSGSMEPAVPTGSIIYTLQNNFYSKGDVIAFSKDDKTISHRVLGVSTIGNEIYYTTKGDANNSKDADMVSRSEVVGRTFFYVPYLGKIVMAFKTPTGFFIGIVLPALIFVLIELWNIKKEIEKITERRVMERLGVSL